MHGELVIQLQSRQEGNKIQSKQTSKCDKVFLQCYLSAFGASHMYGQSRFHIYVTRVFFFEVLYGTM